MRRSKRHRMVSMGLAALFLITVASSAQSGSPNSARDDKSVYAELRKAPAKAVAKNNPLEADREAVAAGAKLFEIHCTECHGATADGGKKGPSLRAEDVQRASPGALFWLLTNGVVRRGMPVWSKLPEPQRWQLVSYIRSLGSPAK